MKSAAPAGRRELRILIVGQSALRRQSVIKILREAGGFEVVDAVADRREAVERAVALQPELVLIDFDLRGSIPPGDIIRGMTEAASTPIIVLASSDSVNSVRAREAVQAGATAVIRRPPAPGGGDSLLQRREFLTTLRQAARPRDLGPAPPPRAASLTSGAAAQSKRPMAPTGRARRTPFSPRARHGISVIAVAASTGGPAALRRVLADLPPRHPPVLVVQHIGDGFAQSLTEWLGKSIPQSSVRIAEHGEALSAGTILIAPTGRHLAVDGGGRVELLDTPAVENHKPAANTMFDSLVRVYGRRTLAVVLTGMGRDGADGLLLLSQAGAHTIAQDAASSVVHGMPGAADEIGAISEMLPLEEIGPAIAARLREAGAPARADAVEKSA